jgi:hypothetical protein
MKMTKAQFNLKSAEWARGILSEPAYTMPNGKNSHDVARLELNAAMDRMIFENPMRISPVSGLWEFCA